MKGSIGNPVDACSEGPDEAPNLLGVTTESQFEYERLITTGMKPGLPFLDSNPNATHTLYLNFTGSRSQGDFDLKGTYGGGNLRDHRAVFDIDGDPKSFNAAEQDAITRIWQYVADDYAPFNVNVTTYNFDLNPSSSSDNVLEVAIGGFKDAGEDYTLWGITNAVGAYKNHKECAVYVFSDLHYLQSKSFLSGPDYFVRSVADTISHEAGHAYGLEHQGELVDGEWIDRKPSRDGTSLLMGVPFIISPGSGSRSQWSWGQYNVGKTLDDLSILTNRFQSYPDKGDGLRKDNVGDDHFKWLPEVEEGHFHAAGFIGINQANPSALDHDWFAFNNPGGPMHLRLHSPVGSFGNLQSRIELWAAHDTPNGMVEDRLVYESWSASWQNGFGFTSLPAGDYMVLVTSTGGYGNLGNYELDITAHAFATGVKAGGPKVELTGMSSMSYVASRDPSFEMDHLAETGGYETQVLWTEGDWTEGSWMEGSWTDGFWTDGTSAEGFWTDGNWTDGFWTDGSWIDGYWGDAAWVDGYWADGNWTEGLWTDGFWTEGVTTEGFWTDGYWTDAAWAECFWTDGFWTDGTVAEGFWTEGQSSEGYWTEELAHFVTDAEPEALWQWTEAYRIEDLAYDATLDDLEWAALNPQPLPPAETEAEFAAIDQAILWVSEELGSGLWDDALIDTIAALA